MVDRGEEYGSGIVWKRPDVDSVGVEGALESLQCQTRCSEGSGLC